VAVPGHPMGRGRMAKKPNYGGEKRQKELQKQKKKKEKAEKKRLKKASGDRDPENEGITSTLDVEDQGSDDDT
jgi:hypothetical protein